MKIFSDFGITVPPGRTGNVATICPQCSAHRKNAKATCLSVNVDEGVWLCHHCDWRGTLKEGVRDLSNPYVHKPKEYRRPDYVIDETADMAKTLEWFSKRGITAEVVRRNRISVGTVWMPQIEAEVSAIRFPYFRDGQVVNVKYRDHRKHFRMESGAERILYGIDDCLEYLATTTDTAKTLIWVEGEIDKLSMEVAGFKNCVSVPDGAPSPTSKDYTSKFTFLESAEELLAQFDRHILAVDNDAPGQKLEEELARRLGHEKCYRAQWPDGCKDANEVLKNDRR